MTTQEFLARLAETNFTDATKEEIRAMINDSTEFTTELYTQVMERLEKEIDADLADVEIDPAEAEALEKEADAELAEIEQVANEAMQNMEAEITAYDEMDQKIDVLERLNS